MIEPNPQVVALHLGQLRHGLMQNVRAPAKADPGLVNSIRRHGLLQPLLVTPEAEGLYMVVDGGRRLAALLALREEGAFPEGGTVPVLIDDRGDGLDLARSLAANTDRTALHPVEQHAAVVQLLAQGRAIEEVGEALGLTAREVKARLALGKLHPNVREAWRGGMINETAAKALAMLKPDQQKKLLAKAGKQKALSISDAVRELARDANTMIPVNDSRVRFVGLEAYTAAGGGTVDSLFSDDVWLTDGDVLNDCVEIRLQKVVAKLVGDGKFGWGLTARQADMQHPNWRHVQVFNSVIIETPGDAQDETGPAAEAALRFIAGIPEAERAEYGVVAAVVLGALGFYYGFKQPPDNGPDLIGWEPKPAAPAEAEAAAAAEPGTFEEPDDDDAYDSEPQISPPAPKAARKTAKPEATAKPPRPRLGPAAEAMCAGIRAAIIRSSLSQPMALALLWLQLRAGNTPLRLTAGNGTEPGTPLPAGAPRKFLLNAMGMTPDAVIDGIHEELLKMISLTPGAGDPPIDPDVAALLWDDVGSRAAEDRARQLFDARIYVAGMTKEQLVDLTAEIGVRPKAKLPKGLDAVRAAVVDDIATAKWLPPELQPEY